MDRIKIKDRAKAVFSQDYWRLVGIVLLGMLLVGGISIFTTRFDYNSRAVRMSTAWSVITIAYTIFVGNVISVGLAKICLAAYRGESYELNDLFYFFKGESYLKVVGAMALYTVFVGLGFICLIIPGIIIACGLSRVPFLLADEYPMGGMDVIKKSWEIMKGNRNDYFVFILSFIGWLILTAVTAGIVGVFYSNPYMNIACAGYHDELMAAVHVE
jgi:uncharacterized membrane protein